MAIYFSYQGHFGSVLKIAYIDPCGGGGLEAAPPPPPKYENSLLCDHLGGIRWKRKNLLSEYLFYTTLIKMTAHYKRN